LKIRLNDDAPWASVTLLDGTVIYRRKWTQVPDNINYDAFKKYIEIEEDIVSIDYTTLTKAQLLEIAKEKKLNISATLKKSDIIEALNEAK
jgi:hypothetical protein